MRPHPIFRDVCLAFPPDQGAEVGRGEVIRLDEGDIVVEVERSAFDPGDEAGQLRRGGETAGRDIVVPEAAIENVHREREPDLGLPAAGLGDIAGRDVDRDADQQHHGSALRGEDRGHGGMPPALAGGRVVVAFEIDRTAPAHALAIMRQRFRREVGRQDGLRRLADEIRRGETDHSREPVVDSRIDEPITLDRDRESRRPDEFDIDHHAARIPPRRSRPDRRLRPD